ncbi:MAG: Na-translocating system protein MpsC family protein [Solirubrobacteraceae bacterium]
MSGSATKAPNDDGQSTAARISNLVVGLVSSYTGRGPTRSWTSIDDDLVCVVLRDTLTKGERSLVADDRSQLVLEMRKAYQHTMRHDFIAGVEAITGRKVIAFLSDNHIDPDIAIESFVLEPIAHVDPAKLEAQ